MPLARGGSKQAFSRNVAMEKPQNQALAIAYRIKRQNRAEGGEISDPMGEAYPPQGGNAVERTGQHFAQGFANWLGTPGRALNDGLAPDEATDWGAGTALAMLGVGAPVAMTAGAGRVGIFGGRLAQTADHAALARAEEMTAMGASRNEIHADTGWFKGTDGKWRFEISDATSKLNPNTYAGDLPEIAKPSLIAGEIWHPDLYAAYPELRNAKIRIEKGQNSGRYFPDPGGMGDVPVIHVNASNPLTARSVALHEIQHDIQHREGFAKGADFERVGMENYVRSAGEQEAANVQRRLFMTPEERRASPPWTTESIPAEQQIVNMGYNGMKRGGALDVAYQIKREGRAMGGPSPASWQTRKEAGAMTHSGPIMSAVAGRTDHHPMNVAAGSYVLPADHVSSLGQGNTQSGMAVLGHMFGSSGPLGIGKNPAIKAGAGAPRPPRAMKLARGGSPANDGEPVPINAAGGEFVIPPEVVAQIGGGDIKRGHSILDNWVVTNRKKHIKTLQKLPGPAKS